MMMRRKLGVGRLAALMVTILATPLFAGSVDCDKNPSQAEKLICADDQLRLLDDMLHRLEQDLLTRLKGEERDKMVEDGRQWLTRRNAFLCPDPYSCMAAYNERMISVRRYSDARKQLNPEQQKMVSRLGELLTEMEASWGVSTESNITRLPDRGLRGLYLRSRLTPGRLADWFGTAVYRSGPHAGAKYDFKNKRDFGHYSPAFLASVRKWFDFLIGNNVTKPMLQGLYDNQLMDIASAYYRMYQYLYAPENQQWAGDLLDRYQRSLQGEGGLFKEGYGYPYHEMREVARRLEKREGLNVHELTTAGAFWLRRRMDGSERAVAEILVQLLDGLEPISGPTR